jgi:toxic protein SymE
MNRFRKLKIHRKFRARAWDYITVPEIRLEGKWLEQLGFEQGNEVIIEQKKYKLTITVLKEKENIICSK